MNKIIASASLVALGSAGLQAADASDLSSLDRSKVWTISGLVRGFYDDNPTDSFRTSKEASWGFEISPSLAVNLALDQTTLGFNYTYDLRYYEARKKDNEDQTHQFGLKISHPFTERYKLDITDSFLYTQEPDLNDIASNPLRTEQNYIHNKGRIGFTAELTPILGLEVAYQNDYWDFNDSGHPGSLSALLDRMEHLGSVMGRWQALPNTVGILGYQYQLIEHSSNDSLNSNVPPFTDPDVRDATSHFVFVGLDQKFTSQLNGTVHVGAQFTHYPNAIPGTEKNTTGPFVDANATWTYNPGSFLQLGVKHQRNQTDVAFVGGPTPVQDQESTAIYAMINHRISPKLTGSLLGQYQHSTFNGGGATDGQVDQFGTLGANLAYQINSFVSAEAGYNYDRLDSDIAFRSYTRNRIYFGVRATY